MGLSVEREGLGAGQEGARAPKGCGQEMGLSLRAAAHSLFL